jgi:hypothetical protein
MSDQSVTRYGLAIAALAGVAIAQPTTPPPGYVAVSAPLGVKLLRPPASVACETAQNGASQAPVVWTGVNYRRADRKVVNVAVLIGLQGRPVGAAYHFVFTRRGVTGWSYDHHHPAYSGHSRCPGTYVVTYSIARLKRGGHLGAPIRVVYRVAAG